MAENARRKSGTLIFAEGVVRWKFPILLALIAFTLFFLFPIVNAGLIVFGHGWNQLPAVNVDTHARAQWPDHPFINAQDKFKSTFGGSSAIAIAVVVEDTEEWRDFLTRSTMLDVK